MQAEHGSTERNGAVTGFVSSPSLARNVPRQEIHSPNAFRAVVHRERARSDRNSRGFVIVAFEVGGNGDRPHRARILIETLQTRCRLTDEVGWIDDRRVGVLLPDTDSDGARVLADHVRRELPHLHPAPTCHVHGRPKRSTAAHGGRRGGPEQQTRSRDRTASAGDSAPASEMTGALVENGIASIIDVPCPVWKRTLDTVGAAAALLLFAPVMAGLAVFIKMVSPGPVFFRQQRIGYMGRHFTCWKFRTMEVNGDVRCHQSHLQSLMQSDVPMTKLDVLRDPRIIPLGTIIRQCGLDELPQLFNVLRGDMSLVGPRPCISYNTKGSIGGSGRALMRALG